MQAKTLQFETRHYRVGTILAETATSVLYQGLVETTGDAVVLRVLKSKFWTDLTSEERASFTIQDAPASIQWAGVIFPKETHSTDFGCVQILDPGPGIFLNDWLKQHPIESIDEPSILAFLKSLILTLDWAQGQGLTHGWIKPDDIFLRDGRLELPILLKWNPRESSQKQSRSGSHGDLTLFYLPLEVLNGKQTRPSLTSDFYSLGMVAFHVLTRTLPYRAKNHESLIQQLESRSEIRTLPFAENRWPMLMAILDKMLRKRPEQRYQTIQGLLYDLDRLKHKDQSFALGRLDPARELAEVKVLVGRQEVLQRLRQIWDDVNPSHCSMVLISGDSGFGKSSIIDRFLDAYTHESVTIFRKKLANYEQQCPYVALEGLIQYMIKSANQSDEGSLKSWIPTLKQSWGTDLLLLFNRFPLFKDLYLRFERMPQGKPFFDFSISEMNRLIASFVRQLASIVGPIILVVDDLQWADSSSLNVMEFLAQNQEIARSRLLVVGSARSEALNSFAALRRLHDGLPKENRLPLLPFNQQQSLELLDQILDEESPWINALNSFLYPLTRGVPFSTIFAVRAMRDAGAFTLNQKSGEWVLDLDRVESYSSTKTLLDWAAVQIRALNPLPRKLLSIIAVMGYEFTHEELVQVVFELNRSHLEAFGMRWGTLSQSLTELLDRSILSRLANSTYTFTHDSLLEAALDLTTADDRDEIQSFYAGVLLKKNAMDSESIFKVADYLKRSTAFPDKAEARQGFCAAAQLAESMHTFPQAGVYWEFALKLLDTEPNANHSAEFKDWMTIVERAAFHRGLAGQIQASVDLYEKLLTFEKQPQKRVQIFARISEYNLARFHYKASLDAGFAGLRELNLRFISNEGQAWLTILALSIPLIFYVLFRSLFRRDKELTKDQEYRFQLLMALEVPLYFRQPVLAIANLFPLTFSLFRYKDNEARMLLLSYWAVVLSQFRLQWIAFPCFSRASLYFERNRLELQKGFCLFVWGYTCEFLMGKLEKTEIRVRDANQIFEGLGERFWRCLCLQAVTHIDYFGKGSGEAVRTIPLLFDNCDSLKAMSTPKNCSIKYFIAQRDLQTAKAIVDEILGDLNDERHGDQLSLDTLFAHLSIGEYYSCVEDYAQAEDHYRKAFWLCFRHLHRVAYSILSPISYARILTLRGKFWQALPILTFSWVNQLLGARIFLPQTCYASSEWLFAAGLKRPARTLARKGLRHAETEESKALTAEGHACLARLWLYNNSARSEYHRGQALEIYEEMGWPFFADKLRKPP